MCGPGGNWKREEPSSDTFIDPIWKRKTPPSTDFLPPSWKRAAVGPEKDVFTSGGYKRAVESSDVENVEVRLMKCFPLADSCLFLVASPYLILIRGIDSYCLAFGQSPCLVA